MIVLVQLLMFVTLPSLCKGCSLLYSQQPPPVLFGCTPYDNTSPEPNFILKLTCSAMVQGDSSNSIGSFDLFWYRRRSCDGMVENLGEGTGKQEDAESETIILQGIANLNQASFSEEMPGEYWCQAVISNNGKQYLANTSNVLTVMRPEDYTGLDVCDGSVLFPSAMKKCAYPPASSTCTLPCISEAPITTKCSTLPKATMEENPTQTSTKPSMTTKGGSSSTTPRASVRGISPESSSMNESPHSRSKIPIPSTDTLSATTMEESSKMNAIRSSSLSKAQSRSSPSVSASMVREEYSMDVIVPVLAVVIAPLFVLLILFVAGIAVILFLRQRSKSRAEPTTSTLQERMTNRLSDRIDQKTNCGTSSRPAESEPPVYFELSTHPQAMAANNSSFPKDSTYSLLVQVAATGDGGKTRSEPHYDEVNDEKEVRSDVSRNLVLSSGTYGEKRTSCVFDDPNYAAPFPN